MQKQNKKKKERHPCRKNELELRNWWNWFIMMQEVFSLLEKRVLDVCPCRPLVNRLSRAAGALPIYLLTLTTRDIFAITRQLHIVLAPLSFPKAPQNRWCSIYLNWLSYACRNQLCDDNQPPCERGHPPTANSGVLQWQAFDSKIRFDSRSHKFSKTQKFLMNFLQDAGPKKGMQKRKSRKKARLRPPKPTRLQE